MLRKLVGLVVLIPSLVFAADFVEGKDYKVVAPASIEQNKMPMVTEFFSYGCPWCYRIESPFAQWSLNLNKNATINKVPVVFQPNWDLYAKAFYTAKTLALSDKLNPMLFKAIQDDKKLNSKQDMINFFVANGVDREIAKSAFENSPTIDMRVKNGMELMAHYQINAVPAFVVNNKYKTDLQMAGTPERLFEIMNYLLKKPA
ncbi:thiol:disulfide interchange protein DsbA/DsbL [Legionella sp. km772]|uniref:thiol:disulfide interchange protein DsbA/DsbL n=1 Tax=Legionella sp. km772 TaxID=2498111 RepID=UPI000F8E260B|nr:thiol:disulfide interchange protein DsbA/DsbL [Legionella sp. km772]RUR12888.1 thiol:disulfide interchange protein DsbA/DsbL [Legionella sp. km772]